MKKEYVAPQAEVIEFDDVVLAPIGVIQRDNGASYHAGAIITFGED